MNSTVKRKVFRIAKAKILLQLFPELS